MTNKLNMSFQRQYSKFSSLINFQSLIFTDLAGSHCTASTWQGGHKGREDMARGAKGGDYSREEIISNISVRGGRLFEGGN